LVTLIISEEYRKNFTKGCKEVDKMKNIKEKWVSKRGLLTILKGREERGGGATEETKKEKSWVEEGRIL
jgi:hypothetical protein